MKPHASVRCSAMFVLLAVSATAGAQPTAPPATPVPSTKFAGPFRITANLGLPELVGLGLGVALGDGRWRVGVDVGSLLVKPLSTAALHLQAALFRSGPVVVGVGVHAGMIHEPYDVFCCGDEPRTDYTAGARLLVEIGPPQGWGLVLEGGVDGLWDEPFGRLVGEEVFPSFAVRVARAWSI